MRDLKSGKGFPDKLLVGLTSKEIADHLGRGLAATRSLQWRAFVRLKGILHEESLTNHPCSDAPQSLRKESDCAVR